MYVSTVTTLSVPNVPVGILMIQRAVFFSSSPVVARFLENAVWTAALAKFSNGAGMYSIPYRRRVSSVQSACSMPPLPPSSSQSAGVAHGATSGELYNRITVSVPEDEVVKYILWAPAGGIGASLTAAFVTT